MKVQPSFFDQNTNEIKKAIIEANNAIALVRAKPKMAYPNNCLANDGFCVTEWIKELNTFPIPTKDDVLTTGRKGPKSHSSYTLAPRIEVVRFVSICNSRFRLCSCW